MFSSKEKKKRDKLNMKKEMSPERKQKFKKFINDLVLCALWTTILIMNICNESSLLMILLDGVCAFCWGLSATLNFISYQFGEK